jgi:hypothetical protein
MPGTSETNPITLTDLFGSSFNGLPETIDDTDIDRARLSRRVRAACKAAHQYFDEARMTSCVARPFDARWTCADPQRDRAYRELLAASTDWLVVDSRGESAPFVTRSAVVGAHLRAYPLHGSARTPNLTASARQHALRHGIGDTELFHHAVAILAAGGGAVTRIPLPETKDLIRASALLGYRVSSLFAEEPSAIAGLGDDHELRWIGGMRRVGKEARMLRGSVLVPEAAWQNEGHVEEREYAEDELIAMSNCARTQNLTTSTVIDLLGTRTFDIYLNDKALWQNVPLHVWQFAHGGTAVLHAWLRDRGHRMLLREEVSQFTAITRRIAALLLLGPALLRNRGAVT